MVWRVCAKWEVWVGDSGREGEASYESNTLFEWTLVGKARSAEARLLIDFVDAQIERLHAT
jgi:hypothetical protein